MQNIEAFFVMIITGKNPFGTSSTISARNPDMPSRTESDAQNGQGSSVKESRTFITICAASRRRRNGDLYVESGSLTCYVGDKQIILKKGEGMFINSRVLHSFYAESAIMPNFVFMPSFIGEQDSLIYRKYVLPIISSSLSFQVFQAEVSWQNEVLKLIGQIIEIQKQESVCELAISALMQMLWLLLYENAAILPAKKAGKEKASSQARLQLMMQYMYQQYQNPLSLEEIAGAASISKSTALNLFKEYLHITPVEFLIQHRLKEAAMLLAKTEKKICVISEETGFHTVDYFCRLFKKYYGVTPMQYRKRGTFLA